MIGKSVLSKKINSANMINKCVCKCKCAKCSNKQNASVEKIPKFLEEINDYRNEGMKNIFENFKFFENFPLKNLLEFIFVFCEMSLIK